MTSKARTKTKTKPPRHTYFKRTAQPDSPEAAFEQALCDVADARDANGVPVRLIPGEGVPTAQALKEATFTFMESFDPGAMFITTDPNSGKLIESQQAEMVAWANLALLARATAAAIRYENRNVPTPG